MNIAYSLSSLIFPCLIYQIMMCKRKKIEYNKRPYFRHFIWCYIFIFYLYLIFEVTGLGSIWDIGKYDEIIRIDEINLIPFPFAWSYDLFIKHDYVYAPWIPASIYMERTSRGKKSNNSERIIFMCY